MFILEGNRKNEMHKRSDRERRFQDGIESIESIERRLQSVELKSNNASKYPNSESRLQAIIQEALQSRLKTSIQEAMQSLEREKEETIEASYD